MNIQGIILPYKFSKKKKTLGKQKSKTGKWRPVIDLQQLNNYKYDFLHHWKWSSLGLGSHC